MEIVKCLSAAPIESVELSLGILMAHCQFPRRLDLEANGVAHFRFLVLEPVGENDSGAMLFASYRIKDWFHSRFQHIRHNYSRTPALTVCDNFERRKDRLQNVGADGCEDLEVKPALLTAIQCQKS